MKTLTECLTMGIPVGVDTNPFPSAGYNTPMNTLGMGDVDVNGGADALAVTPTKILKKKKRKKKFKSLKDYLIHKKNREHVKEKDINGEYQ